jgi:hypothetical protein
MIACNICGKEFPSKKSMTNHRRWHNLPQYKDFQQEHKERFSKKWKGVKKPKQQVQKMIKNRRSYKNEDNPNWKGDDVGYSSLHLYIRKNKLKPNKCEECDKTTKRLELANISGKYKRNINDYKYLCVVCHKKFDGNWDNFLISGIPTRFKKGDKSYSN